MHFCWYGVKGGKKPFRRRSEKIFMKLKKKPQEGLLWFLRKAANQTKGVALAKEFQYN